MMAQFIEMEMEAQEGPTRSQDQVGFLGDCVPFPRPWRETLRFAQSTVFRVTGFSLTQLSDCHWAVDLLNGLS